MADQLTVVQGAQIKSLIHLAPQQRKEEENKELLELLEPIDLFKHIQNSPQFINICQRISLRSIKPQETLFTNKSDQLYIFIVVLGCIKVVLQQWNPLINEFDYSEITSFGRGSFFWWDESMFQDPRGEVLFQCQLNSDLAYFSKSFFDMISRDIESDSSNFVLQFLQNIQGFKHLTSDQLRRVASQVHYKKFDINTLIYRQGDIPGFVYFILFGGVQLVRKVYFKFFEWPHLEELKDLIENPSKDDLKNENGVETKMIDIKELKPGDFIGISSMVSKAPMRSSVITSLPTEMFIMDRMDFLNLPEKIHLEFERESINEDSLSDIQIRKEFYIQHNWSVYKTNLQYQYKYEKKVEQKPFMSMLRTEYQPPWKKLEFYSDEKIHQQLDAHYTLPPVNNKVYRSYINDNL